MKTLISIIGTTGIGKTKLAIKLAKHFQTEIISCDSRQFFREMKIGTAAPTTEELAEIPHHFIGNLSDNKFLIWCKDISNLIESINIARNYIFRKPL